MQRNRKSVGKSLFVLSLALALAAGCGSEDGAPPASLDAQGQGTASSAQDGNSSSPGGPIQVRAGIARSETPATIVIEDTRQFPEIVIKTTKGDIYLRLDGEKAPVTVDNFLLNYADRGFYDNTVFHYVDKDFMIAAGGYTSELRRKETWEGIRNEANNGLKNLRGTIAMSRYRDDAESANCEFFINLVDNPALDYKNSDSAEDSGYCVFGEVTHGMEIVDSIGEVAVADQDQFPKMPSEHVRIKSITKVK